MDQDDDQRWLDIVITAFERCGSRPSLPSIYDQIERLIRASKFKSNRAPEATVRRLLQAHCASSKQYGGGPSLFVHTGRGRWQLDKAAVEKRWNERQEAREFLAGLSL